MSGLDRLLSIAERFALKMATKHALTRAGGGNLSPFTRKSPAQLYRYGSNSAPDREVFAPVDIALEMDRAAEEPIITAHMASALGYRLAAVDEAGQGESLNGLVSRFIQEAGDVSSAVLDAQADGIISPSEHANILKEIREAEAVLTNLRRRLSGGRGK